MDPSVFYGKSSNTKNVHMFTRLPPNNPADSDDPDLSESDDDLNEEDVILAKESDSFFEEDADLSESDDDLNEEDVILAKESDSFFEEDADELKTLPLQYLNRRLRGRR
ncbi:hypothetical protein QE152_g24621 [Popillia japonica]|uniref:Uncharacterized protein n=1 Tax=Popillia japonica TaxID=7064 RepID=A0AAW1K544_POPJA